jgi:transcriptional regulator with XRE-family HTH domain
LESTTVKRRHKTEEALAKLEEAIASQTEDRQQMRIDGTESHPRKLTKEQVGVLFFAEGSTRKIAEAYGISHNLVARIKRGEHEYSRNLLRSSLDHNLTTSEFLQPMITDEQNEKNREAALKRLAEVNAALGIETPEGDPIIAANAHNPARFSLEGLKAAVRRFHKLKDEATGATLAADVWKAFNRPGAWSGKK